jgi:DNA topoisomerase-1
VGSHRYADENESFGASTLRRRHLTEHPDGIRLEFTAKSGIERDILVTDRTIAGPVLRCHARGKRRDDLLFRGPEGGLITGDGVAEALSEWSGLAMSAKDLRTWGATAAMIAELMEPDLARNSDSDDPLLAAYDGVAARLGNTRDVARSSYVAPAVTEAYESGELRTMWSASRRSTVFSRAEQCGRKLFGG